jgi:hypothetical protein
MCRIGQAKNWRWDILSVMTHKTRTYKTRILKVEMDSDDGLFVTFSDGTTAGFVIEELLLLRPAREHVVEPLEPARSTTTVERISFSIGAPHST